MREGVTSYSDLIKQLDTCIENGYNESDCKYLILKAQNVLSEVWIRMKREAGITKYNDDKFTILFEEKLRRNNTKTNK